MLLIAIVILTEGGARVFRPGLMVYVGPTRGVRIASQPEPAPRRGVRYEGLTDWCVPGTGYTTAYCCRT